MAEEITKPVPVPAEPAAPEPVPGVPEPRPAEPAIVAAAEPAAEPEPKTKPTVPTWAQDRINKLTAQKRDLEAKLAAKAPATSTAAAPVADPAVALPTKEQLDALIVNTASALADQRDFDRRCNEISKVGAKTFDDFLPKAQGLLQLVDMNNPADNAKYTTFLTNIIDAGEDKAHELLYALSGDLDEANRIMNLSPAKMAVELVKRTLVPAKEVSRVGKPPVVLNGAGGHQPIAASDKDRADALPTDQWMKLREQEIKDARAAGSRIR